MELAYIVDAVALVIECRRVLKWTYVHAFFEVSRELCKAGFWGERQVGT